MPAIQSSTISFRSRQASRSVHGVDVGNCVAVGLGIGVCVGAGIGVYVGVGAGGGGSVGEDITVGVGIGFGVSVALSVAAGVGGSNAVGDVVVSRSIMPNPSNTAITTIKPMKTAISDAIVMAHPFRHLRTLRVCSFREIQKPSITGSPLQNWHQQW